MEMVRWIPFCWLSSPWPADEFKEREEALSGFPFLFQMFPSEDAISGDMTEWLGPLTVAVCPRDNMNATAAMF